MPCYCDIPDESNQIEIEHRCKERMYFDSINLLTNEQIEECSKRELKLCPFDNINNHLCKLCEVLTEKQMESIPATDYLINWKHKTLLDWYNQHKIDDENLNSKKD